MKESLTPRPQETSEMQISDEMRADAAATIEANEPLKQQILDAKSAVDVRNIVVDSLESRSIHTDKDQAMLIAAIDLWNDHQISKREGGAA